MLYYNIILYRTLNSIEMKNNILCFHGDQGHLTLPGLEDCKVFLFWNERTWNKDKLILRAYKILLKTIRNAKLSIINGSLENKS